VAVLEVDVAREVGVVAEMMEAVAAAGVVEEKGVALVALIVCSHALDRIPSNNRHHWSTYCK